LFDVLARVVFRPLTTSNITAPSLFRTLHDRGGTVLFDEAERLRQGSPEVQELLSMFLAGYKRGGTATRLGAVGDSSRPVWFDVFGPKALACIAGLPPALSSRCIPVMMFRAAPGSEKPKRSLGGDGGEWALLRDDLHALALEWGREWLDLAGLPDVVPAEITNRDPALWHPPLALAALVPESGSSGLLSLVPEHALATVD